MSYPDASDAAVIQYVGFWRLAAQWSGQQATLMVREVGTFKKGTGIASELAVVEGSGRGPLAGATGHGTAGAKHGGGSIELTLTVAT